MDLLNQYRVLFIFKVPGSIRNVLLTRLLEVVSLRKVVSLTCRHACHLDGGEHRRKRIFLKHGKDSFCICCYESFVVLALFGNCWPCSCYCTILWDLNILTHPCVRNELRMWLAALTLSC